MENFETVCAINQKTYEEIKWHLLSAKDKFSSVLGIFFAVMLIVVSFPSESLYFSLIGFALVIAFAAEIFRKPKRYIKLLLQRMQETRGITDIELHTSFTEDGIKILDILDSRKTTISYDVIRRFSETTNMYILFTKTEFMIIANKAALIQEGKNEDFLQFIKNKLKENWGK